MRKRVSFSWKCLIFAAACFAISFPATANAQSNSRNQIEVTPTVNDSEAASAAKVMYRHARPANTPAGRRLRAKEIAGAHGPNLGASHGNGGIVRYPGDVTYLGGAVVPFTTMHAVYMLPAKTSCQNAGCWGNPERFLRHLGQSDFIHLADQYIGLFGGDRYTVGFHANVKYTESSAPLTDNDILAVVHAVASASGDSGYGHLYHVFLPPGQDECFTSADTECYSPDNPATFYFCGYHGSVDFSDIGHVIYSVEPFQDVPGCQVRPGTPNGQLVDSTDNVLNHETFETITDPDGNAWINATNNEDYGAEVADECAFITFVGQSAYFDPPTFNIGGHSYAVQSIYSNSVHGCGTAP